MLINIKMPVTVCFECNFVKENAYVTSELNYCSIHCFRIDSNVEDAQLNIEAAHSEILKYFQSVTNNRWLMIKIFAVLIIFFIIFIVFMA